MLAALTWFRLLDETGLCGALDCRFFRTVLVSAGLGRRFARGRFFGLASGLGLGSLFGMDDQLLRTVEHVVEIVPIRRRLVFRGIEVRLQSWIGGEVSERLA